MTEGNRIFAISSPNQSYKDSPTKIEGYDLLLATVRVIFRAFLGPRFHLFLAPRSVKHDEKYSEFTSAFSNTTYKALPAKKKCSIGFLVKYREISGAQV